MQLVHEYELIGGMPEIVSAYVANDAPGIDAMESARNKQQEINVAYLADMAKYATPTETPRIMAVWNSIPQQLAKENHKFQYKLIKSGAGLQYTRMPSHGWTLRASSCDAPKSPRPRHR